MGLVRNKDHGLRGVTSLIRAVGLKEVFYDRLLDLFHSKAVLVDSLAALWCRLILTVLPAPLVPKITERPILKNDRRKIKLVCQFLAPLFAKICWYDHKEPSFTFGPFLGNQETGLDCFPQAHFIGQNSSAGKGIAKGK